VPPVNTKNAPISPAVGALGLGDQLALQVSDAADDERKRKLKMQQAAQGGVTGAAANALFPAGGVLGGGMNG